MNRDERARHRRIAWQEQRTAFFNDAGEPVADGVDAQVWPVVADADDNGGFFVLGTTRLSKVHSDKLNHVRL